jgi:hypothetical protein
MNYYEKYMKYKMKYLNLQKTINIINNQIGGLIKGNDSFLGIKSIGFELETADLVPILLNDKTIMPYGFNNINGSLTNKKLDIKDFDTNDKEYNILVTQDSYHLDEELKKYNEKNYDDLLKGYVITKILEKKDLITPKGYTISINRQSDDSTYGNLEFKITYLNVKRNKNIFYDKMMIIYKFLKSFITSFKMIEQFEIKYEFVDESYYIYEYNELYFLSTASPKDLDLIEITPQITIGCDLINVSEIIGKLIEDYNDYTEGNNYLKNKLDEINNYLQDPIFQNCVINPYLKNYIFLVYFFLNVSKIDDYIYDKETNRFYINRDTISIKIRHNFYNIFNKLAEILDIDDIGSCIMNFLDENVKEKIKKYRIKYINNLIANRLIEINKKYAKNVIELKNSDILWNGVDKNVYIDILKKNNINIFTYDNIDYILDFIINSDHSFLTGSDGKIDQINSGGTIFEYNDSILLELRYISNKNALFQNIDDTIAQLNLINSEEDDEEEANKKYRTF